MEAYDASVAVEGFRSAGFEDVVLWTDEEVKAAKEGKMLRNVTRYDGTDLKGNSTQREEPYHRTFSVLGRNGTTEATAVLAFALPSRCVASHEDDLAAQCKDAGGVADVLIAYFEQATRWSMVSHEPCAARASV
jgi:hypothetical protein